MSSNIYECCNKTYLDIYQIENSKLLGESSAQPGLRKLAEKKSKELERETQKTAIWKALLTLVSQHNDVDVLSIWQMIHQSHIHRKSGYQDMEAIDKIISAEESWKKSSGHAFEELIRELGTSVLSEEKIEIVLQRELSTRLKQKQLRNDAKDIEWLTQQTKSSSFDLYAISHNLQNEQHCFGVIQSKTSIRDRVSRDREPSIQAMERCFWSIAFTLDGTFLEQEKFNHMVNGNSSQYDKNGWHGMYVFSKITPTGRIYQTDIALQNVKQHAALVVKQWNANRVRLDQDWKPEL